MFGLFNDPFDTVVEEGPVRITFSQAYGGRVKLHITVDFSKDKKSNDDPHVAATKMGKVVGALRRTFRIKLEDIKV